MKTSLIQRIESEMTNTLNNSQIEKLDSVLKFTLYEYEITKKNDSEDNSKDFSSLFISSKRIEGCSERTLNYYKTTIDNVLYNINKNIKEISTEELRDYLSNYQKNSCCSKVTIDNVRRILSSFFNWLEAEDYIVKSPMRRIHKIKTMEIVKETYSDEVLETLRDGCTEIRDLAIIDFLSSTGVRVGELVKINKDDINFEDRSCVVLGKGNKQREVYFDARAKLHLQKYLESRTDNNDALFVSLLEPFDRLEISGVEIRLRQLGEKLKINNVYPHKFRRTLATRAIDKGMPIEQVQRLLGHKKIDTTLQYAMVNQNNVKISHHKYICS